MTNAPAKISTLANRCGQVPIGIDYNLRTHAGHRLHETLDTWQPHGVMGEWQITAPAGTTISAASVWRDLEQLAASEWRLYGRRADGTETEFVQPWAGNAQLGGYLWNTGGGEPWVHWNGLSTRQLAWGMRCTDADCASGGVQNGSLHAARVNIYSSRITVDDPVAPTPGALSVPSGWQRVNSVTVNVTPGTDSSGIREVNVTRPDGVVSRSTFTCDFTKATNQGGVMVIDPCPHPTAPVPITLNVGGVEGTFALVANTIDAAENTTASPPVTLRVDNVAPPRPVLIETTNDQYAANATLNTTVANTTSGSPLASTSLQVCRDNICDTPITGTPAAQLTIPTSEPGLYEVRLTSTDQAGNTSDRGVVRFVRRAVPPPAPPQEDPGPGPGQTPIPPTTTNLPPVSPVAPPPVTPRTPSPATSIPRTDSTTTPATPAAPGKTHLKITDATQTRRRVTINTTLAGDFASRPATITLTARNGQTRTYRRTLNPGETTLTLTTNTTTKITLITITAPATTDRQAARARYRR